MISIINWRFLVWVIVVVGLQACQHRNVLNTKDERTDLHTAALYNAQLGLIYLNHGERSRAKLKLLLALNQAPNAAPVNAAMGYFMEKSGELDNARTYYQKALHASPRDGAQLNNYGAFLCRTGRYQQAEAFFILAASDIHYEYTATAYENAGLCALAIPNVRKAKMYFARALRHDPMLKQSRYELAKIEEKRRQNEHCINSR